MSSLPQMESTSISLNATTDQESIPWPDLPSTSNFWTSMESGTSMENEQLSTNIEMTESPSDSSTNTALEIIISLSLVGFCFLLMFGYMFYKNRKEKWKSSKNNKRKRVKIRENDKPKNGNKSLSSHNKINPQISFATVSDSAISRASTNPNDDAIPKMVSNGSIKNLKYYGDDGGDDNSDSIDDEEQAKFLDDRTNNMPTIRNDDDMVPGIDGDLEHALSFVGELRPTTVSHIHHDHDNHYHKVNINDKYVD